MEARLIRVVFLATLLLVSLGASYRSTNFIVETPDARLAQQIAEAAEKYRHDLAVSWLGRAMPPWNAPCVMKVRVGSELGAGGATTFVFDQGEVYGWRMDIQGSKERIFDSVLPHEITHMVLASHFRCPLPRWAAEGAATSVEHSSERAKHFKMLYEFLTTGRGIAFNRMYALREYPRDVMPLYAQGFSVVEYLIQRGGRRRFIAYLEDGLRSGQWSQATQRHYDLDDLGDLQNTWLAWIRQGHPALNQSPTAPESSTAPVVLADAKRPRPEPNLIYHEPRVAASPGMRLAPMTTGAQPLPETTLASRGPVSSDGWRAAGSAAPPACAGGCCPVPGVQPQLARPPSPEPMGQIILER